MSVDMGDGTTQERCIPIPRWVGIGPVVVGTRHTDIPMAVGVQRTGGRPMAACTPYSGNDMDTGAIYPSQQKMTKSNRRGSDRWLQVLGMQVSV